MTKNEELLQRCFDDDLNDGEMKHFFSELSGNADLRNEYRSLQSLLHGLRSIPSPNVPSSLDHQMNALHPSSMLRLVPNRSSVRQFASKRITMSVPALAAVFLLMLLSSYVVATNAIVAPTMKTEYVYVVEMPAYVVQSNYQIIKNN